MNKKVYERIENSKKLLKKAKERIKHTDEITKRIREENARRRL